MKIIVSRLQVCNRSTCPMCGSKNVNLIDSGCPCRSNDHSCWQHPVCGDCGFTAGPSAGNSDGGIWVSFNDLGAKDEYVLTHNA